MSQILFVTTFNQAMYEKSGKSLIDSFLKNTDFDLLVCSEGFDFESKSNRIIEYVITNDPFLNTWTKNNKEVIPAIFGGSAPEDHPIFVEDKKKGQHWARYRAAGYFRKITSLNYAITRFSKKYDVICIVDSDCIIKNPFPKQAIEGVFEDGTAMFFFWSRYRKIINRGPETGFTGFCIKNGGLDFAKLICKCFISQDFRRFEYWDDGFVVGRLIEENKSAFVLKDIVGNTKACTTRVMEIKDNTFFNYIHHFKNRHEELYEHLDQFN